MNLNIYELSNDSGKLKVKSALHHLASVKQCLSQTYVGFKGEARDGSYLGSPSGWPFFKDLNAGSLFGGDPRRFQERS